MNLVLKLSTFRIKNFKSLQDVNNESCANLHTFIGRNSIGKSSIFEAIGFINSLFATIGNTFEIISGGIGEYEEKIIELELVFELSDFARIQYFAHFFRIIEPNELIQSNMLKRIRIILEIRVYGIKFSNPIFQNIVLLKQISVQDSDNSFVNIAESSGDNLKIWNIIGGQAPVPTNPSFLRHHVTIFGTQLRAYNQPIPHNYFQARLILDIRNSIKFLGSFREISKVVPLQTILNESEVDVRGSNLINLMDTMLSNHTERYFEVENYCKAIFPDIESIRPEKLRQNQVRIILKKKNLPNKIDLINEGTGIDQLLIIIWRIATSQKNTIWLLDEPEIHLHPGAQKLLYDFLRDETERGKQILVTTHSMVFMYKSKTDAVSILVDKEGFAEIILLDDLIKAEKKTSAEETAKIKDNVYKVLGYDPVFAFEPRTIVMVEGKTDELVIKEFSKLLGNKIDDRKIHFIPIGDKKRVEQFSPILTYALSGKKIVIILDNDDEKPDDIWEKILNHERVYRNLAGISSTLLSKDSFCPYTEAAYSIEYYLLDANAICTAAGVTSKEILEIIRNHILAERAKQIEEQMRPKDLLRSIWEDNKFGPYHETETAKQISSKMDPMVLSQFPEIVKIIKQINS